jgi:hypothetical protein
MDRRNTRTVTMLADGCRVLVFGGNDGQVSPDIAVDSNNEFVVIFDPGIESTSDSGFFVDVLPY